jgi:hypothetical protein
VKANRAFHLIVSRESIEPAFFADADRLDRIEVVSIDDGEVALYWDLPPKEASKVARELREDLVALDAEAFRAKWLSDDDGL